MKKAISQWAFPGNTPVKECIRQAKDAGFDGIELAVAEEGEIGLKSQVSDMKNIKKLANDTGIEISSLASGLGWKYQLSSSDSKIRSKAEESVEKSLELASGLEVDTILVVPATVCVTWQQSASSTPYEDAYKRALESVVQLAKVAEKYKVFIGIENVWNGFLLSPLEMRQFIDDAGSKYVGAYFDVGNVVINSEPQDWIRILGSRIKKVHFKNFKRAIGNINGFCGLLEGDVNWPEVIKAFKEIGYNGWAVTELGPYKYCPEQVIKDISFHMDRILKGE
ncbi:MAG: sugar phosphate isomerase/epimerase family protein [Candidatus Firestonebacteria bacterium]